MANPPITGESALASVAGIRGENTTPRGFGIKKPTDPGLAIGVNGISHEVGVNGDGGRVGVRGESGGAQGFLGGEDPIFQQNAGVYGESDHQGVMGLTTDAGGTGVYGGSTTPGGGTGTGVRGETSSGTGVLGRSFGSGTGVFGTSEQGEGLHGETKSVSVAGVAGFNVGSGTGPAFGVFGHSLVGAGVQGESVAGHGVHGQNGAGSGLGPTVGAGVFGESDNGFGVFASSTTNVAVSGESRDTNGVLGVTHSSTVAAVSAVNKNGGIGMFAKRWDRRLLRRQRRGHREFEYVLADERYSVGGRCGRFWYAGRRNH